MNHPGMIVYLLVCGCIAATAGTITVIAYAVFALKEMWEDW